MKTLVIIDMQNDFTNGVLGNERCDAVVPVIVSMIQNKEYNNIIFTRDTHQTNYFQTQEGIKLPVEHCIEGTNGWQIRDEIISEVNKNYNDDLITYIDKPSFGSLKLSELISGPNYKDNEFYFCGVCTGICVISNVAIAKATLPENKIYVIENACACVTEESHNTAISAMKTFQVDVI